MKCSIFLHSFVWNVTKLRKRLKEHRNSISDSLCNVNYIFIRGSSNVALFFYSKIVTTTTTSYDIVTFCTKKGKYLSNFVNIFLILKVMNKNLVLERN